MPPGRRPDPDELQDAKGRPGKRAPRTLRPSAPRASATASKIRPIVALVAEARRAWNLVAPGLDELRFLRPTDAPALTRYCQDLALYHAITTRLGLSGDNHTYESESAHGKLRRISPDFIVQERIAARLIAAEDRFGLSPSARHQVLYRMANAAPSLPTPDRPGELPLAPPASPIGVLNTTPDPPPPTKH